MKATKVFRVRFSGPLDRAGEQALEASEAVQQAHRDGRHEVLVQATAPDVAIKRVRKALDGHGRFLDFSAEIEDDDTP